MTPSTMRISAGTNAPAIQARSARTTLTIAMPAASLASSSEGTERAFRPCFRAGGVACSRGNGARAHPPGPRDPPHRGYDLGMSRASALDPVTLRVFNALEPDAAAEVVAVWAAIPGWVDAVVAGRPYDTVDALAARADTLARAWTPADLDAALAHHPRIGQKPSGTDAEAAASTREQASMSTASDGTTEAIAAGNAAYEERFGRVFLIRAAGRSPEEMLAELTRRLGNDDEAEAAEALDQLRQIALLRLEGTIA